MSISDYDLQRINIVEIDIPRCSRTFGVSPCNATGDTCFKTSGTCKFESAFDGSLTTTYRFCTDMARLPVFENGPSGINSGDLLPTLAGEPRTSGATVDLSGGLGIRGKFSCSLIDHPFDDAQFGADPHIDDRTYNPLERGTFWSKLKARDPYLNGRELRYLTGTISGGVVDYDQMVSQTFIIEAVNVQSGAVSITAKDILKLADNNRAQWPRATNAELLTPISSTDTTAVLTYKGADIDEALPASGGIIRIDDELITYSSRTGTTLTLSGRGYLGTLAADHSAESQVQLSLEYNEQVHEIIYDALINGTGVDPSFINLSDWQTEIDLNYPTLLNGVITEPTGVNDLLKELGETAQTLLWWDSVDQLIKLRVSKQPVAGASVVVNADHMIDGSYKTSDQDKDRISQVWVYYGVRNPVGDLDEASNYELVHVRADLQSETDQEYGTQRIQKIYSRWINRDNKTAAVNLATKLGQRFGKTPRSFTFAVTPRDASAGLTDAIGVENRLVTDATGSIETVFCQVIERNIAGSQVSYKALEHPIPRDLDDDIIDPFVIYPQSSLVRDSEAVNLRELYDLRFPAGTVPTQQDGVLYIVDASVSIAGSPGIKTGTWSDLEALAGYPIELKLLIINDGKVSGVGGSGGTGGEVSTNGEDGSNAIELQHNLTIVNVSADGYIGAGGGGGGGAFAIASGNEPIPVGGGGGASFGVGGSGRWNGDDGTQDEGGDGATQTRGSLVVTGGKGGDINQDGQPGVVAGIGINPSVGLGGDKGAAVVRNGYTLTVISGGARILGDII